jgi:glycosyltransferase involved in cell wall biosynthesis
MRIGILSYRSNPYCGGQGVYVRHLATALADLGHQVEVISGPPQTFSINHQIPVTWLEGLDLYNPQNPFRMPTAAELCDPVNFLEWAGVSTMGFPEPFTFGIRAFLHLKDRLHQFDILHDNQCLSYGTLMLARRIPFVTTIHHPITVDRSLELDAATNAWKRFKVMRWYSFIGMQLRVARKLPHIITVSHASKADIQSEFSLPAERFHVVENGIDTERFKPMPHIEREPGRIIVTNSADTPLKGLAYLLIAIRKLTDEGRRIRLIVIGTPKRNGSIESLIRTLGLVNVHFTGHIDDEAFVEQYARAAIAVVPSLYEGFGLPAGEAMACGVPVVSTTGGALAEVVGDAGILVPPADADALAEAIARLLDHPGLARELGKIGYRRVHERFTWRQAAQRTLDVYRKVIRADRQTR